MSEIKINDLKERHPVGAEFFTQDDGYLENLNEGELNVWGGTTDIVVSIDNRNGSISIDEGNVVSLPDCIIRLPVSRWPL